MDEQKEKKLTLPEWFVERKDYLRIIRGTLLNDETLLETLNSNVVVCVKSGNAPTLYGFESIIHFNQEKADFARRAACSSNTRMVFIYHDGEYYELEAKISVKKVKGPTY